MRTVLNRMAIGFFVMMAFLILLNLAASKLHAEGYYDWTFSHHNRDRGWASSAFQEQHGPRVRGTPRYRPGGDRPYRRYYRPRTMVTDEVIRPEVRGWHSDRPGSTRRDATADVHCWPHVEAWSVEANTEDGAWKDAQRNWENQVRAMYGERFMDIGNAKDGGERQCFISSGNQSVAGRVAETVGRAIGSNDGGVDGRKHRCRVMLRPCQAPKEHNPTTKADR